MSIPDGFKVSEVGVIPEDWDVYYLGDKTVKIGSGITPTGGSRIYKTEGRPFLRSQNIGWGTLSLDDVAYIDDIIHDTFKSTEIQEGDVFLNITGASIGRSAIADQRVVNGNVNQHVCIIRPIEEELNPYFLNCFLLSHKGQKQIDSFQSGGNRQGLNYGQIKLFKIPLPPLAEQKAIAQSLSDVDNLITAIDKLITKKRNIKQGTMQELLTGKKRLPGFTGEWEVKTFKDVSFVNQGLQIAIEQRLKQPLPNSKKYITIQFLNNGKDIEYINDYSSSVCCNEDDVLMTRTGNTGIVVSGVSGVFHNNFFKINFDRKILDKNYLIAYLRLDKTQKIILAKAGTSTIPDLNHNDFYSIFIHLPSLPEQKVIAKILTEMDEEIEALEKKREKYKNIKQGMMQELLTGKTRLKINLEDR